MITVYKIINNVNDKLYFGITKTSLNLRWNSHVHISKKKNTPLYAAIRKYGPDRFKIIPIVICDTWEYACEIEKKLISSYSDLYNLALGGQGGFNVRDIEDWKRKLRIARKGGKPFLGGHHTQATRERCGEAAKRYHQSRIKSNELN